MLIDYIHFTCSYFSFWFFYSLVTFSLLLHVFPFSCCNLVCSFYQLFTFKTQESFFFRVRSLEISSGLINMFILRLDYFYFLFIYSTADSSIERIVNCVVICRVCDAFASRTLSDRSRDCIPI